MGIWAEMRCYIQDPIHWWRLACDDEGIRPASRSEKAFQWLQGYVTDGLKVRLETRLGQLLHRAETKFPLSEEEKILVDKIQALLHRKTPIRVTIKDLPSHGLKQPIFENGRFYNFHGEDIWKQFRTTLALLFVGALRKPSEENLATWNRVKWKPCARSDSPKVTRIGHSTTLLQIGGWNILLDPMFEDFIFPCFHRHTAPGIKLHDLPDIDVLDISHVHADHCGVPSVGHFAPYQPFTFLPEKLDAWFRGFGYTQAKGARWWRQTTLERDGAKLELISIPAIHGSQTGVMDINKAHWKGTIFRANGKTIYYAGDTAFDEQMFRDIHAKFPKIDLALLPIAPEDEPNVHVDHIEALKAARILQPKKIINVHCDTIRTGPEQIEEPRRKFLEAAQTFIPRSAFAYLSRQVR